MHLWPLWHSLDQGFAGRLVKPQFVLVFELWLLGTIVISNGHSDIMVALMSKEVVPNVPNTLQELVESDY